MHILRDTDTIEVERAKRILESHGSSLEEFLTEYSWGNKIGKVINGEVNIKLLKEWLGY